MIAKAKRPSTSLDASTGNAAEPRGRLKLNHVHGKAFAAVLKRCSQLPSHMRGRAGFSSPSPANRSLPFKSKLKLESLNRLAYTHFTQKPRGANRQGHDICQSPLNVTKGRPHEQKYAKSGQAIRQGLGR